MSASSGANEFAIGVEMQAALLRARLLPPPPPGPLRLARRDRTGAGGAADRDEAAFVQGVGGHAVGAGVFGRLIAAPIEQRVDLQQCARLVPTRERGVAAA